MNPATIALIEKIITTAAALIPIGVDAYQNFEPFAALIWRSIVKGEAITPADVTEIEGDLARLSADLQAVDLGPAQPGDPDYVPPAG